MKNKILHRLHLIFAKTHFIHLAVAYSYQLIVVPVLSTYLKFRFPNLKKVIIRNSLSEKKHFDAFLSDIDLTIVIDDHSDAKKILLAYLKLKDYFLMLDQPEIYEESEYQKLSAIQASWVHEFIQFCWYFRKINWSLFETQNSTNEFEIFKKKRSLLKALSKISSRTSYESPFTLQDFPCFDRFKVSSPEPKSICYWSQYLETASGKGLQLLLNQKEFNFINSLMPGEPIAEEFKTQQLIEVKSALQYHELYLCMNTVRSRTALSKDVTPWIGWIEHLHKQLGINS